MSVENLNNNDLNNEEINTSGFDAITEAFEKIYYEKNNVAEVEVEAVKTLNPKQDGNLRAVLEKIFAKKVVLKYNINPTILGGLRVKYESKMFDDTLAAKLNYLENVMKGK